MVKVDKNKVLVKKVAMAMKYVKQGCPLKDFLEHDEIEEALKLLVVTHKSLEILQGRS